MIEPVITSIRFYTSAPRRKPKCGDLRETKKHGKQVRVFARATWNGRPIGYLSRGGHICYEWVSYDEAHRRGDGHLVPNFTDAPGSPTYPLGYMQQRGAA